MYGKANELDLLNAEMTCEKEDTHSLDCDCMTRMMTPEDWAKYGPVNNIQSKKIKKTKDF
ncbi:hypothetical protein [Desulfosporosinus fructosivorans]